MHTPRTGGLQEGGRSKGTKVQEPERRHGLIQRPAQVGSGEESPVLLEGPPLSEIDPVKQLAQQLDACALDDPVAVLIKAEDTPPSGEPSGAGAAC